MRRSRNRSNILCFRVNMQCCICGGILDEEGVCNIGLHVEGQRYTLQKKKKEKILIIRNIIDMRIV